MKKLLLLSAVMLLTAMSGLYAQSCSGSKAACCKKGEKTAMVDSKSAEAAAQLASQDATIEKRVCEETGKVTYLRKVEAEGNAEPKLVQVSYNAESGQFEDVASAETKSCCSKAEAAGCCSGKAPGAKGTSSDAKVRPTPAVKIN